jgi:Cu(I)/Ag(I) efflux system membrane fusion protein
MNKNRSYVPIVLTALVVGIAIGMYLPQNMSLHSESTASKQEAAPASKVEYTCSMHPDIRLPDADAKCPICFMDLIEVSQEDSGDGNLREIQLSPRAQALAQVQTHKVTREYPEFSVKLTGKVTFNERGLRKISAWAGGRIERLFVDNEGIEVKKGDRLFSLYSPEIYTAQSELIEAQKAQARMASAMPLMRDSARATVAAAREKLKLLGLTAQQISKVEKQRKSEATITIRAPSEGTVIRKPAFEGMYVKKGTTIFEVADLKTVWVELDAYETTLPYLRYSQDLTLSLQSLPNVVFEGKISFISPTLKEGTRIIPVRVIADNSRGILKPGMLVRGMVEVKLDNEGMVVSPSLAGKWISPRHPEIVSDSPGNCSRCGIQLVSAEALGYSTGSDGKPPLLINESAPLITGKRAVVYRRVPHGDSLFEGVDVVLGPKAGKHYIVIEGLNEGDEIVTNGAFKLDSSLQIRARPSMMGYPSPDSSDIQPTPSPDEPIKPVEVPVSFHTRLTPLFTTYFSLQQHLAHDRLDESYVAFSEIDAFVGTVSDENLSTEASDRWFTIMETIVTATATAQAEDMESMRQGFFVLTQAVTDTIHSFGYLQKFPAYDMYCPMARDNTGASWYQNNDALVNPYFGAQMFRCGETRQVYQTSPAEGNEAK